jgi:hypothetical protein
MRPVIISHTSATIRSGGARAANWTRVTVGTPPVSSGGGEWTRAHPCNLQRGTGFVGSDFAGKKPRFATPSP